MVPWTIEEWEIERAFCLRGNHTDRLRVRIGLGQPLLEHDRARLHTGLEPGVASGSGTVEIEGIEPDDLVRYLWEEHRTGTTPIVHDEFRGIRVSPSVYTTTEELDRFVGAMETTVRERVPEA